MKNRDLVKFNSLTLDFTQAAFEAFPNNETAGAYLRALMEYEADDMIGDDTFLDGLVAIRDYLNPKLATKKENE